MIYQIPPTSRTTANLSQQRERVRRRRRESSLVLIARGFFRFAPSVCTRARNIIIRRRSIYREGKKEEDEENRLHIVTG